MQVDYIGCLGCMSCIVICMLDCMYLLELFFTVSLDCSACLPRWQLLLLVYQSPEQQ